MRAQPTGPIGTYFDRGAAHIASVDEKMRGWSIAHALTKRIHRRVAKLANVCPRDPQQHHTIRRFRDGKAAVDAIKTDFLCAGRHRLSSKSVSQGDCSASPLLLSRRRPRVRLEYRASRDVIYRQIVDFLVGEPTQEIGSDGVEGHGAACGT